MAKKKTPQSSETQKERLDELTEWQKRHLEFQAKKLERQKEKAREEERQRREKMAELTGEAVDEDWESFETELAETFGQTEFEEEVALDDFSSEETMTPLQKALPLLLFSIIVFLLSLFMVSPYSKKKLFLIQGTTNVADQQVLDASGIATTDYITQVFFSLSDHEKNLVANEPWVQSARMTYEFPNHFIVMVEEFPVVAYQQTALGWQPVLASGDSVDVINSTQLPEKFLALYLENDKQVSSFIKQLMTIDESLVSLISEVRLAGSTSTKDLLNLTTEEGHLIRVPLSEVERKLPYYQSIKANLYEPSIVDMEVGVYTTTESLEAIAAETKAAREALAKASEVTPSKDNPSPTTEKSEESESASDDNREQSELETPESSQAEPENNEQNQVSDPESE